MLIENHYKRTVCRMCDESHVEKVISIPATPIGDHYISKHQLVEQQVHYPLDVYLCAGCGQLQLLDVVNPELIYKNYIYESGSSLGLKDHFKVYADSLVQKYALGASSKALDIGCNDGTFLYALQAHSISILGIEPAVALAQENNAKSINTIAEFFCLNLANKIVAEYGQMDLITANNVVANVDDLYSFLWAIKELLSENGIFVFESGYCLDTVNKKVLDNIYHEHLSYLRLNPLAKLFSRVGLEVIDIEYVDTKGGSLRVFAQKQGGLRKVQPSVLEYSRNEEQMGFEQLSLYKEFSNQMESVRTKLQSVLSEYANNGKKIAGYGASVGVTTLIYYFGLDKYISLLVDDNPKRYGLYSPGHHIPVFPSSALYEQNVDVAIILAWRYAMPIVNKHVDFVRKGGQFINPLPELSFVA